MNQNNTASNRGRRPLDPKERVIYRRAKTMVAYLLKENEAGNFPTGREVCRHLGIAFGPLFSQVKTFSNRYKREFGNYHVGYDNTVKGYVATKTFRPTNGTHTGTRGWFVTRRARAISTQVSNWASSVECSKTSHRVGSAARAESDQFNERVAAVVEELKELEALVLV